MNNIRLFQHIRLTSRIFYPRYALFSNMKQNFQYPKDQAGRISISSPLKILLNPVKLISNCSSMQTRDPDFPREKNDSEKVRKVLEDEEFQSILKDFANDFGVDSETNELLDDIRKNIDEDYEKNNQSAVKNDENSDLSSSVLSGELKHKYKEFSDDDFKVIHSHEEHDEKFYHIDDELKPKALYEDLRRGVDGVFDLKEMVQVLHNESLLDVAAISIPKELHYADYLVLATAKSGRHSSAVAESINKLYKQKKDKKDPFIIIVGEKDPHWKALDMGNIVLHIFLQETRELYDLESCWTLDTTFDSGGNAPPDPMLSKIEEQIEFFNQQSKSSEVSKDSD